ITTPESFENGLPVCWSIEGDSISVSTDLGGYDGTHALRMAPSDTSFLILPKVEGSIRDYRINYFAKALSDISASRTVLYAVNDNGDKIETEAFYSLDAAGTYLISSTDWSEHTMGISEMDNNDYSGYNRLAIQLKSSATTAIFYDNITLIYLKNIFTNNVGDNLWFNDTNWSLGHIPTQYENVVIPAGKVVNSTPNSENPVKPIGKVVVLEDNLTDGKAQFPISNFHKHFSIQAAFKGYSNYEEASQNSAGWYLFGIPLWVDGGNVVEMRSVFNPKEGVDDLYYWDASQASEENMGTWINWFDEETDQTNFFIYTAENRVRCYLVSYAKDTTITFTGNVYDGINYTPLYFDNNSSSFTAGNWYLFYNPHTAKINLDNIKSNYYSVPQILSVDNATYQPLEEDEGITTIDPYQGFFVQMETVPEGDTHYFYTSETTIIQAKATQQPQPNKLTLNIASNSYPKLKDLLRIKIKDDATLGFDWKTDNRKLEGLGNSPEISLLAEEERYIVNAIPQIEDSISFDIHLNSKFADNYTLSIDNKLADSYTEISLYDKQTGTLLVNFLEENTYTFYSDIYNGERFVLKMTKNPLTLDNIKKTDETITLQQNKELLKVITKDRVKHLELFNIKGQKVNSNTNNNEITIPTKGCFILNVITENKRQEFKVINL
ncbi:MAG: T9SS type A sorting domain-containing protein, partial [Endomicrobium sp.]|nr:T9SS type A sorting domain-containing protein [Endomicrobium sp.]